MGLYGYMLHWSGEAWYNGGMPVRTKEHEQPLNHCMKKLKKKIQGYYILTRLANVIITNIRTLYNVHGMGTIFSNSPADLSTS